jgi:hypothetical protein
MRCFIIVISLLAVAATYAQTPQLPSFRPKDGFIPNAETAVKVGEAVLIPVYGEKTILNERPFKATLHRDEWTVEGTVPCDGPVGVSCKGGAALVRISKTSGQILFMMHYK